MVVLSLGSAAPDPDHAGLDIKLTGADMLVLNLNLDLEVLILVKVSLNAGLPDLDSGPSDSDPGLGFSHLKEELAHIESRFTDLLILNNRIWILNLAFVLFFADLYLVLSLEG